MTNHKKKFLNKLKLPSTKNFPTDQTKKYPFPPPKKIK